MSSADLLIGDNTLMITRSDCSYYGRLNKTGFGLIRSYEGIPENLIVNLVVSSVRSNYNIKNNEYFGIFRYYY